MTNTYTPIASVTLSASAAEVVFSSIPATFRDLVLVINGGVVSSTNFNFFIAFNSDTTNSNYSIVQMSGTGSAVDGSAPSSILTRLLNYFGFPQDNLNTNVVTQIMDYSATDKHKTYLSRSNNAANGVSALASRWANTNAITSVAISSQSGNIRTGTTVSLYGIVA